MGIQTGFVEDEAGKKGANPEECSLLTAAATDESLRKTRNTDGQDSMAEEDPQPSTRVVF
jgi:hypothetical protein